MLFNGILGFFGFGNMGQAIAGGLLSSSTLSPRHLLAFDISEEKRLNADEMGVPHTSHVAEFAQQCTAIILAVKPQDMETALTSLTADAKPDTLYISIAAGVSIAKIQAILGEEAQVIRVMPNTPALVGAGAAGYACSATCTETDAAIADLIFSAVGIAERVDESMIDVVTALSGSGPAYFFRVVEHLIAASMAHGLDREQATRLAGQTLLGAGKLLAESGESAEVLRARVTSKGGTTEAALKTFDAQNLGDTIRAGVDAAVRRSKELGQ